MASRRLALLGVPLGGGGLYFSDLFDSALPGWSGSGSVAGGALTITPSEGATLFDAGADVFTSGTYGWVAQGGNAIANDGNQLRITYVNNTSGASLALNAASDLSANLTLGTWYRYQTQARINGGSCDLRLYNGTAYGANNTVTEATLTAKFWTFYAVSTTGYLTHQSNLGAGEILWLDNQQMIPLSALFHGRLHNVNYGVFTTKITRSIVTQAGLFFHADSPTAPANYDHVYLGGDGKIYWDKVIAGTRTPVGNAAAVYSADAPLVGTVYRNGTYDITYNAASIATGVAASGASGKYWGLFSSHASNSFSEVSVDSRNVA